MGVIKPSEINKLMRELLALAKASGKDPLPMQIEPNNNYDDEEDYDDEIEEGS